MSNLSRSVSAVILAGGLGTRMGETESTKPKYLREISDGQTLLKLHLDRLLNSNVSEILLLVGSRAELVESYITSNYPNPNKPIKLIRDSTLSGTAGAILGALQYFDETALVLYADTIHNVDIEKFMNYHARRSSSFTTLVHPNAHPFDSDQVILDSDDRIIRIYSKEASKLNLLPNLCMAAMFCVEKKWLESHLVLDSNTKKSFDIVLDFLSKLNPSKHNLYAYRTSEFISDVGTPERFQALQDHYRWHYGIRSHLRPTVFLDRDGTINLEKGFLTSAVDVELLPGVAKFLRFLNRAGILSICITNQPAIARGLISEIELQEIHCKLEYELANLGAYLDGIYFCPHHPDSGFIGERSDLKIACKCRKPNTQLLSRACRDHAIKRDSSFFVGNSEVDQKTADNFGLQFMRIYNFDKSMANALDYELQFEAIKNEIERQLSDHK